MDLPRKGRLYSGSMGATLRALLAMILMLWLLGARSWAAPPSTDPLSALVDHPLAKKAVQAYARGRYSQAAKLASQALVADELAKDERVPLRFLRALSKTRAGLSADPADWMAAISGGDKLGLVSHASWYLGKSLWDRGLSAGEAKAHDLAGPYLSRVGFPGRFGIEARSRKVRGLLAVKKTDQACALAERTAEAVYRRFGEAQAVQAVAACRERQAWDLLRAGKRDAGRASMRRAAQLYKQVAVLWPDRWAGPIANKNLKRLAKAGHKPGRLDPEALLSRARDIVRRPMGLRDLRRLWRVRSLLPWNLKDPAGAEAELLWAELSMRHRKFKRSWRSANRVRRLAPSDEFKARAALLQGRLTARRRSLPAVAIYLDLVKRWPKASSAAPALYQAAEISRRKGKTEQARKLFKRCTENYAGQPAADLCRWGLGWDAVRAGKTTQALTWIGPLCERDDLFAEAPPLVELIEDEQDMQTDDLAPPPEDEQADLQAGPVDEFEDVDREAMNLRERARYWQARLLEQTGDRKRAATLYTRVASEHPFSYYALMAIQRLALLGKAPPLAEEPADSGPPPMQALHPEVAAAVAYYRLGLINESRATLMTLRRSDLPHSLDRRWAALLRERMGDFSRSHRMAPVPRDGGLPDYPESGWRIDAMLAYPRAFAEQVLGPARDARVPANLLYALMRVESGFWAEARSPANARGLTQVITRTAWAMARRLKVRRFSHWRLYDPEMSVRIGSAYLAGLLTRYGHPVPAIAAYNAGEPSVDRWLRKRGHLPVDMFIEEIPYAETSGYTRRLLSWWAIYRLLYESPKTRPLDLDFELPRRIAPRRSKAPTPA